MSLPQLGHERPEGGYYGLCEYIIDLEDIIVDLLDGCSAMDIHYRTGINFRRCDEIIETYNRIVKSREL